jgi:hypothetical protein
MIRRCSFVACAADYASLIQTALRSMPSADPKKPQQIGLDSIYPTG